MSEFKASGFRDEFGNAGPDIVGLTTFTSPYYFVPPSGTTAERPSDPSLGMLRFNTDIGRLEVWRNDHWATILGESPNLGDTNAGSGESRGGTGVRGVITTGFTGSRSDAIEYITISTLGNGVDFGNLTVARSGNRGGSSRTRAIFMGGMNPSSADVNTIDFVTIASTGNATDFNSDLLHTQRDGVSCSNQTRALFAGGQGNNNDVINAINIATTGITANDFGDLLSGLAGMAGCSNSVRGIFAGGTNPISNVISYVTIPSYGNAQDFGDLLGTQEAISGASNSIRGVLAGGSTPSPSNSNLIQFISITTTGNAQDFGDLTAARQSTMATASPTRAIFAGGATPSASNVIDYVEIMTTGNAVDFGDTNVAGWTGDGVSNGHGGL